jgi:hypothetical protein
MYWLTIISGLSATPVNFAAVKSTPNHTTFLISEVFLFPWLKEEVENPMSSNKLIVNNLLFMFLSFKIE